MNSNENNFARIEAYLFGQLSPSDKEAFESELENNEDLAASLALHQMEHQGMEIMVRDELRENLNQWKAEKESTLKSSAKVVSLSSRRRFFQYAAAAVGLALAGFFIWTWSGENPLSNTQVADSYFETSSARSRSDLKQQPFYADALNALNEKEYGKAVEILEGLKDSSNLNSVLLLQGEAFYLQKNYTDAANAFQEILQNSQHPITVHEAEWRLALTWLAAGNEGAAFQKLLNEMANNDEHSYHDQANILLSKLR